MPKMNRKTDIEKLPYQRFSVRLARIGFKLAKRGDVYIIYAYNEVVGAWVEAEGLTPIPYSLSLEDVIRLTHEYWADNEVAELDAA